MVHTVSELFGPHPHNRCQDEHSLDGVSSENITAEIEKRRRIDYALAELARCGREYQIQLDAWVEDGATRAARPEPPISLLLAERDLAAARRSC